MSGISSKMSNQQSVNPRPMQGQKMRRRALQMTGFAVFFAGVASFTGGCATIIGIEDRKDVEVEDGVIVDAETEIRTTELCIEYCDEVMDNCVNENAVYTARSSCLNTCNALPPGTSEEPFGNTTHCRLSRARGAASVPDEECVAAGPGGGNACGSNCEAWCQLLESECPDDFSALDNCEEACSTIPDEGGFDVDVSYDRDDIQCRLIHLGAVASDEVHCNHVRYVPQEFCATAETGEPSCARACDAIMGNCTEGEAVYESEADCLAACSAFPLGDLSDRAENTVGCRLYHGTSGALDPLTHCDHAGPTGDGHCGEDEEGKTGPCSSYCMLMEQGCPVEFAADFGDADGCAATCTEGFADNGGSAEDHYTVETARDDDSLQCRVYYAVKALAGDLLACDKARLSGSCD